MSKVLTTDQIEQYRSQGFVAPIDVMSEDEAGSYRERFEKAVDKYPEAMVGAKRNNPHLSFKCLDELVHHPRILDAVEDLIGANISLWGSVMFVKEPKTPHYVSWHQDATYMDMNKNNFVTPWLALSPSTPESGCMRMIPASHLAQQNHQDTFAEDNILTRGQVVSNVDESKAVDVILRPGQMSLHHAMVVHDSQPNNSDYRRIGFAIQSYMSPDVQQTVGENYWMDIRGDNPRPNSRQLRRPAFDMDPEAQADLDLANANFAKILYNGSAKQGVY